MKLPYKLILASLLCTAPLVVLVPGCGGGGGSSTGPFRLETSKGILFDETATGNLIFQVEDTTSATRKITGRLQILKRTTATPTAIPTVTATSTAIPGATATPVPVPNTIDFYAAAGTYIINGTLTGDPTGVPFLNASGSFQNGPTFKISGPIANGRQITIEAAFIAGPALLQGTLLKDLVTGPIPTATPRPTAIGTPGGTPVATTTPTTTGTPFATPIPTSTPISTPAATNTPFPTATPVV